MPAIWSWESFLNYYAPIILIGVIGIAAFIWIRAREKYFTLNKRYETLLTERDQTNSVIMGSGRVFIIWDEDDDLNIASHSKIIGADDAIQTLCIQLSLDENSNADLIIAKLNNFSQEFESALIKLRQHGNGFKLNMHGFEIVGDTIGAKALLEISRASAGIASDHVPIPIWRTNAEGELVWGNKSFLQAVEMPSVVEAVTAQSRIDAKAMSDAKLVVQGETIIDSRAINMFGARHIMRIIMAPSHDGAIGMAFDITEENKALEILNREAKAHVETLNHLNDAVAVFDASHSLTTYNNAFSQLWGIDELWLNEKPTHEEFLDKLRERSRLPHLGNYLNFKAAEIAHYKASGVIPDETWTLPDGRILRIMRQRQPSGGLLILFEDISDKTSLQSQFKTQIEVQRATLDRLNDAVAVFSSDGKLALANIAFEHLWRFEANYLHAKLDFSKIYRHCVQKYSDSDFWLDIEARICDPSPDARQETQGQISLSNGTTLNWLTRPLPDGATLLAFADVTAHNQMEKVLREKAEALTEADKLKTAFLGKVSYQLRAPLNTIKGYSELLESGMVGELNDQQKEFTKSVHQASEQLEKMIDDLLDLAVIDAGQAPLNLGDVNVFDVLKTTRDLAMSKLNDVQIKIEIDCDEEIGLIRADDKRIRQIMANLMNNAMRTTTPSATIKIAAKRTEDDMKLSIISPLANEADPIEFDAFTEGSHRGGMGLVLVKKFVELHGGWVAMKPTKDNQVLINCHLPIIAKADASVPELDL